MLNINLEWDANALAAPQSFRDAVQAAANILDAAIYNSITANIEVGYGEYDNGAERLSSNISLGGVGSTIEVSYPLLKAALTNNESSPTDSTAFWFTPATALLNGQGVFYITGAQAKALGVISATDPSVDGYAGFPPSFTGATLIGAAIVELVHALGLLNDGLPLSLFEYTSPGNHLLTSGTANTPAYFSIDGGVTNLASYDVGFDSTLFSNPSNDPLSAPISGNLTLTSLDLTEISAIGYDVASAKSLPAQSIIPTATAAGSSPQLVVQNISVTENTSVPVLSLIKSVLAPAGDSISVYAFYDQGGGSGYFAVNGVKEPDKQWIYALSTQLQTLQYFGGTSPGSETLEAYAFDYTANTYTQVGVLTATTAVNPAIVAAINALYQSVLGRPADPGGLASYEMALAQPGGSLAGVQASLAASAEAAADINTLYLNVLGRPADSGGLASFETALAQPGWSLAAVQASLASSAEAAADINGLYLNVLGRAADPAGLATYQAALGQHGASLSTVQASLASSAEAAADINGLYLSVLGRAADAGGLATFQAALGQHGASLSTIQATLAGSPEAAADINTLYLNVLGRNADPGGLATYQAALGQQGASLGTIQAILAGSAEAAADINALYQSVLGRQADPGGLANFQQLLGEPGQSLATIRSDLLNSAEAKSHVAAISTAGEMQFMTSSPPLTSAATYATLTAADSSELLQMQVSSSSPAQDVSVGRHTLLQDIGQKAATELPVSLGSSNSYLPYGLNDGALIPNFLRATT